LNGIGQSDKTKIGVKTPPAGRSGGVRPMAALMPKVTRKILGRRGFAEASIITEWATIVGDNLARSSQPEKLAFPKGERVGGVLHIRTIGGGATELQHLEPQILERINQHFGYRAVGRLKLIHLPLAKLKLVKRKKTNSVAVEQNYPHAKVLHLDELEHKELRAALEKLGRAVATRNSN